MVVVDTNVIAYLFIEGVHTAKADALLQRDDDWRAPRLWRSEFRNVLALYLRKDLLTFAEALQIQQQAEDLLAEKEYEMASGDVLRLVESSDCSAYDCEFVALAQTLDCLLITSDKKVLREFPAFTSHL